MTDYKFMFKFISMLLIFLIAGSIFPNQSSSDETIKYVQSMRKVQWPGFGYDRANTGQSPYKGPQSNKLKWQFELPDWGNSVSIGADGTVYVSARIGRLHALNKDGSEKWYFKLPFVNPPEGMAIDEQREWKRRGSGGTITGLAIGTDGTIYFGQSIGLKNRSDERKLYALNNDGALKWTFSVGSADISTHINIGSDGTIYFGTIKGGFPGSECTYYALNPDGTKKWSKLLSRTGSISSAAIGRDGTIYVGGDKFRAFNPQSGSIKWEYDFQSALGTTFAPAVARDGTIYVVGAGWSKDKGKFLALNSDGTIKWETMVGASETSPAVSQDGTIYVTSWKISNSDPKVKTGLTSITPKGAIKWSYGISKTFPNDPNIYVGSDSSPIIGADGIIYFGSDAGYVYAVNPNGTLKWKFEEKTNHPNVYPEFDNSPAIDADGTLYICHAGGPGANHKVKCYAISDEGRMTAFVPTTIKMTKDKSILLALKEPRVKELLRRHPNAKSSASFSKQYGVWLVEFVEGNKKIGFASVSKDGRVLEVEEAMRHGIEKDYILEDIKNENIVQSDEHRSGLGIHEGLMNEEEARTIASNLPEVQKLKKIYVGLKTKTIYMSEKKKWKVMFITDQDEELGAVVINAVNESVIKVETIAR